MRTVYSDLIPYTEGFDGKVSVLRRHTVHSLNFDLKCERMLYLHNLKFIFNEKR